MDNSVKPIDKINRSVEQCNEKKIFVFNIESIGYEKRFPSHRRIDIDELRTNHIYHKEQCLARILSYFHRLGYV